MYVARSATEMKRSGIEVRCGKQRGALRVAMRSEKEEKMTSKQRAYLKSLAMKMEPIMQIGKATITPELTESVEQALEARELIKINVLKNCVAMPVMLQHCWQNGLIRM